MVVAQPTNPQAWPFGDAILVTIDIECHCRNQTFKEFQQGIRRSEHRVTEIGIASFDPRQVAFDAAGDRGVQTWNSIKARNFAIIEHKHVIGRRHPGYCKTGDANDFLFGKTTWIPLANAKKAIVNNIRQTIGDQNVNPRVPYNNKREVIFLFFDDTNDLKWLRGLGIDLDVEFPNSRTWDIQQIGFPGAIARARHLNGISAHEMFDRLRFQLIKAHNGGNDAVYELRAYIAGLLLKNGEIPISTGRALLDIHGDVIEEKTGMAPFLPENAEAEAWAEDSGVADENTAPTTTGWADEEEAKEEIKTVNPVEFWARYSRH